MKFITFIIIILLSACSSPDAQQIIDKLIEAHGGDRYLHSNIEFDFRGRHFKVSRNMGIFKYERIFTENDTVFHEILDNNGLMRFRNEVAQAMTKREYDIYHEAVNSVVYFLFLPYALNDEAVQKRLLATVQIKGTKYYQIEVTFRQEGGGVDYTDRFVHYIHSQNYTLDYFSYADEGGNRFRESKNRRTVNGIIFNDYNNYKEEIQEYEVEEYYKLFNEDKLNLLSKIDTENIRVKLVK